MSEQADKKVSFVPFHAINRFMRAGYRREVARKAVLELRGLPGGLRSALERQIKRHVSVPGFRNSAKAPPSLVARHLPDAFEKHPDLVRAVLAVWAENQAGLRGQLFELLTERGWELLPQDADRTKLPGFLTVWPAGEDFEAINRAFAEKFPQAGVQEDDVSLMAVWLSGRLPLEIS